MRRISPLSVYTRSDLIGVWHVRVFHHSHDYKCDKRIMNVQDPHLNGDSKDTISTI